MLIEKCKEIVKTYETLQEELYKPEIFSNIKELTRVNRQLNSDKKLYELAKTYVSLYHEHSEAKEIIETETDQEMIDMARLQLSESATKLQRMEEELTEEMLPKDPNDDKDCFVEIRPAA